MAKNKTKNIKIQRLLDANANRLKEGLRVLEDIARFIMDDARLCAQFKKIRHEITDCLKANKATSPIMLIEKRQIQSDVGKKTIPSELNRKNIADIFLANAQRVKESIRVLEECIKLFDQKAAERLKSMRYSIYHLEKRSIEKIVKICNNI